MDKEVVGNDKFMGQAKINILDWIAKGFFDGTIDVEDKTGKHVGKLRLSAKFMRFQTSLPSSNGTGTGGGGGGVGGVPSNNDPYGLSSSNLGSSEPKRDPNGEFSNDEIYQAFQSFDLDNNNYVGAAEIRHVLVNIGEKVTDEEVRQM